MEQKFLVFKMEDGECRNKIQSEINSYLNDGWTVKIFQAIPGDKYIYATVFVLIEKSSKTKIDLKWTKY